jgi:sensor histidine kinase regulating citrate/malate metabolism
MVLVGHEKRNRIKILHGLLRLRQYIPTLMFLKREEDRKKRIDALSNSSDNCSNRKDIVEVWQENELQAIE